MIIYEKNILTENNNYNTSMSAMTGNFWFAMRRQSHQALLKRALAVQMSECMAKPAKRFAESQLMLSQWGSLK